MTKEDLKIDFLAVKTGKFDIGVPNLLIQEHLVQDFWVIRHGVDQKVQANEETQVGTNAASLASRPQQQTAVCNKRWFQQLLQH